MDMTSGSSCWPPTLKTIEQQEPITRSRFIQCPSCKNRSFKLKRTVEVGRCKNCQESYKIVVVYVKTGIKPKQKAKPATETRTTTPESTLPSWQMPSDSSLFGTSESSSSSFSKANFDWGTTSQDNKPETSSDQ